MRNFLSIKGGRDAPSAVDPADELQAERARLGAALDRFKVVDDRRVAAEARLEEVDAALNALDAVERGAVQGWAEAGEGDAPTPLIAERKSLLGRRLDAEAEAQASRIAVDAVHGRRAELIVQMNGVGARLKHLQLSAAVDEAKGLHAEAVKLGAEIGNKLMRVMGLQQAVTELDAQAVTSGNDGLHEVYSEASSTLSALKPLVLLADPATVAKLTAEWRGKLQ